MTVQPNQLAIPFTQADADKLATVQSGAQQQPPIASQAVAVAGVDNLTMMTPLRVKQAIQANAGGGGGGGGGGSSATITGIIASYFNNTGFTLGTFTLVCQDSSGDIQPVNPSVESQISNIIGILTQNVANGTNGNVLIDGLFQNITTSFSLDDSIWLNKDSTLTNVAPDIGVNGFVAGDFIVKVGKITKNSSNPTNVDLLVQINVVGQL